MQMLLSLTTGAFLPSPCAKCETVHCSLAQVLQLLNWFSISKGQLKGSSVLGGTPGSGCFLKMKHPPCNLASEGPRDHIFLSKSLKSELTSFIKVTTQASFLSLCNGLSMVQSRVEGREDKKWRMFGHYLHDDFCLTEVQEGSLAEEERGRLALQRSIQLPQPWRNQKILDSLISWAFSMFQLCVRLC